MSIENVHHSLSSLISSRSSLIALGRELTRYGCNVDALVEHIVLRIDTRISSVKRKGRALRLCELLSGDVAPVDPMFSDEDAALTESVINEANIRGKAFKDYDDAS
jgi:hypothetical protein